MYNRRRARVGLLVVGVAVFVLAHPADAADTITSPDTVGSVGADTSIVLDAAGNPVISYFDATNGDLKVLHCDDPNCAGVETPTSPDTAGLVGWDTSIALDAAGNPVISYFDATNGDLKVLHCDDPNCAGIETPTSPDTAGLVGWDTSIVLDAAGNPVISYQSDNNDLKVLHCDDPNCAGTETPTSPDNPATIVGWGTSIVLDAAGNPVISYWGGIDDGLKVLHCDDPNCAGIETPTSPDTAGFVGLYSSIVLDAAGNPVISYLDGNGTNHALKVLHCDDPNCAGTEAPTAPDTPGFDTSIVLDAAGNPVIAYQDLGRGGLKVLHCDDPNCAGIENPTSPDTAADSMSIVLDAAGNPVIAYRDTDNGDVKVLHCDDPACDATLPPPSTTTTTTITTTTTPTQPTTTTVGATTTTTTPVVSATTQPPATTEPPVILPPTGSTDRTAAAIGAILLTAGTALLLLGRRSAT